MSTSRKLSASEQLEHIEDALIENLLNATGQELHEEITAAGGNPNVCIAGIETAIASAREECVQQQLNNARVKLNEWREKSSSVSDIQREKARVRLQNLRSSDRELDSKMMMAARKGKGLSKHDIDVLIEDIAELDQFERENSHHMPALRPAENMLLELGIQHPHQIDLEAIAWMSGAVVKYQPLEQCEGMIIGTEMRAIITVNSNALSVRQRFSLAHEIGHWHYHRGRILVCGDTDIENPARRMFDPENQADQFASELLLPNYMFRPRVTQLTKPSLASIREISDEFNVSVTATLLKLANSDVFPIIVVCHNKQGRRWFRRAPMISSWWFPKEELHPESFAFDMLFGDKAESSFPRKIGADAWFEFRNVQRYEVQEQSFMLPNEEVLTLLILPEEAVE